MSSAAHRFGRVEFRIFVVVFYRQAQLKKSKQIFENRNVQIDELPKTLNENHEKKSGFIDSGFVKTCDELVIGLCPLRW